jgi:hypothetical protein
MKKSPSTSFGLMYAEQDFGSILCENCHWVPPQLRSWDPMFEEAALCAVRQSTRKGIGIMAEQMVKESFEIGGSGSFTPLPSARSLCAVDHLPPNEDV